MYGHPKEKANNPTSGRVQHSNEMFISLSCHSCDSTTPLTANKLVLYIHYADYFEVLGLLLHSGTLRNMSRI